VTLQNPSPAVPSLHEADAAGNTPDVNVDYQLLDESAGGDSLPDVDLPGVPAPDVPLTDVHLDGSAGEE